MQHTNDDIDEMFRNAADSYPLKIKGADWDSVAGRLLNGDKGDAVSPVIPLSSAGSNKNYRYLLLLLLLPAAFFTAKYAGWMDSDNHAAQPVVNTSASTPSTPGVSTQKQADAPAADALTGNNNAGKSAANSTTVQPRTARANAVANMSSGQIAASKNNGGNVSRNDNGGIPSLSQLGQIEKQNQLEQSLSKFQSSTVTRDVNASKAEKEEITQSANPNAGGIAIGKPIEDKQVNNADGIVKEPATSAAQPVTGDKLPVTEPVVIKRKHNFYIGAFVAPDYTTIKYQPGNKVGFDFGGLVGYTLSKSFSVEFGISLDKKYYTSDGRYYNSTEKWFQNAGKLLTLSGYSSLTEFPLNVRYNFKQDKNKAGNFFISGGLVSYIVHSENYNYEFDKNGYIYQRDKSSKKSTTNMFANFNISAGYSSSLGNNVNFRIEPYYRIPISGIGLGSLPITSIGLNIGIVKKFK
ncbi:MAG TPA: hypothetical protein VG738_15150 [Chitinophagaceae bacterium]|nr:hypothetical protein [Chitinophagaceae bacterium]